MENVQLGKMENASTGMIRTKINDGCGDYYSQQSELVPIIEYPEDAHISHLETRIEEGFTLVICFCKNGPLSTNLNVLEIAINQYGGINKRTNILTNGLDRKVSVDLVRLLRD